MKEKELEKQHKMTFDELKRVNEEGHEFWFARDLQKALNYASWNKFNSVIEKAKEACENSEQTVDDHFSHLGKMVSIGFIGKLNYKLFVEMYEMVPACVVTGGLS